MNILCLSCAYQKFGSAFNINVDDSLRMLKIHCESKKQDTLLVLITLRYLHGFSLFFHCCTQHKICYKMIVTHPTTP